MREMKDSGIEWIGAMPRAWKMNTIAQIFLQVKCKNTGLQEKNLLSLSYGKVKRKSIDTVEGLLPESFDGYNIIEKDDIVLRLTDLQNDHTSLRVGLAEERGIITSAYLTIRNRSNFCPKYLYYYLHSFDIAKGFYGMGAGVRQGLNWDGVKWLKILAPSVPEQERIAAFLDAECAEIDTVLEKTRASIEEYKKLKQAVITQAVTKGIRGDRPMKDSGIEWIGEIPKEFETLQLKFLCKLITDGTHFSPSTVETGLPYITAGDVHGIGLDYNSAKRISEEDFNLLVNQGCQPLKGDVLLVKDGATTGRVGFVDSDVPCVILSSVAMLRPADNINGHYLMYLLASYFLQNQILVSMAGSAMPRITLTKLVKYIGLLSPLSEQQEIADYLDEKCAGIDALITKKQQYLTEIENYKKSLIYEYVTGKKEVHPL